MQLKGALYSLMDYDENILPVVGSIPDEVNF
jgi:hypothetical protein